MNKSGVQSLDTRYCFVVKKYKCIPVFLFPFIFIPYLCNVFIPKSLLRVRLMRMETYI